MLAIAAPVAATMLSYSLAQFVDAWMLSEVGPNAVAAQGNGGIIAFALISTVVGGFSVINTFVSQNFGAKRLDRTPFYPWNGIWISLVVWAFVFLPFAALMPWIWNGIESFRAVFKDTGNGAVYSPEIVALQTDYARILLVGGLFTLTARAVSHFFYGIHRPGPIFVSTLLGNVVNVVLNYCLIFGEFGFPEWGVQGAAVGTVIGGFVEFLIPFLLFIGPRLNAAYQTRAGWRPSLHAVEDILRIGWPQALLHLNEMLGWFMMMTVIIGGISDLDNAAGWIGLRWMMLSFMPTIGLSIAVTAVVGKYIGMGRHDLAASRTWLALKIAGAYMGACGLLFFVLRNPMVSLFIGSDVPPEDAAEILRLGGLVMICAAVFQIFDAIGITLTGALRGAGDTVWPGLMTAFLSWTILVGGGLFMVRFFPDLRSIGPWIAASMYLITFAGAMTIRFLRGNWRRIELLDRSHGGAVEMAERLERMSTES